MAQPNIEPIVEATLPAFAHFLHENLNRNRTPAQWEEAMKVDWSHSRPNYGFAMWDNGEIVGGIGAIYATRLIAGREENFCNLTSWCVLEKFRKQSMRLAMEMISQEGYHYTDFSPTAVVAGVLKFLKFKSIDERQTVVLNLPNPFPSGQVHTDPDAIDSILVGDALRKYRDHAMFPWLYHVLVGRGTSWCHIIYKRRKFKGLTSAHILYASDVRLVTKYIGTLTSHLAVRGIVSTQIETRFLGRSVWPSRIRSGFNAKLYLSSTLDAMSIDCLYSESVAIDL